MIQDLKIFLAPVLEQEQAYYDFNSILISVVLSVQCLLLFFHTIIKNNQENKKMKKLYEFLKFSDINGKQEGAMLKITICVMTILLFLINVANSLLGFYYYPTDRYIVFTLVMEAIITCFFAVKCMLRQILSKVQVKTVNIIFYLFVVCSFVLIAILPFI